MFQSTSVSVYIFYLSLNYGICELRIASQCMCEVVSEQWYFIYAWLIFKFELAHGICIV